MSGRLDEMSFQVAPASQDSKTCPMPAPGPSVHLRLNPLMATKTWWLFALSTSNPETYRLGTVPSTGRLSWCQPVPFTLPTAIPRVKPWLLHGPHQPTYASPPDTDTAVATWPSPRLKTFFQSAPDWIANPFVWTQTCCPPATQVLMARASAANGAMNRARPSALSGGAMLRVVAFDGSLIQDPSLTAQ